MPLRFTTIFPLCENVHLTKDLGQIPYFLQLKHGYDARILTYRNSSEYSNLEGEVRGLKLEFIENRGRVSFAEKAVLSYIWRQARQIDILNLYIFSKHAFVYGILYKIRNPRGFIFLKLDGYNETFSVKKVKHSVKPLKNLILRRLEKWFLKHVDLISIENSRGESLIKKYFSALPDRCVYIPVGVNDKYLAEVFGERQPKWEEKEDMVLCVGRIGEPVKNSEMLVKAFCLAKMPGWKLVLAGPVRPEFMDWYESFIAAHPHKAKSIVFTGQISDRAELYRWYQRSKVFCMTSLRESFCHSLAEAIYFGNFIIGTEGIMSLPDLTGHGKFGVCVGENDAEGLARVLDNVNDGMYDLSRKFGEIMQHARENFIWSRIIDKIHERIYAGHG